MLHDHSCEIVSLDLKRLAARWDARLTECVAARYALDVALRLGFDNISLEGDALMVVNVVRQHANGLCSMFRVIDDVAVRMV